MAKGKATETAVETETLTAATAVTEAAESVQDLQAKIAAMLAQLATVGGSASVRAVQSNLSAIKDQAREQDERIKAEQLALVEAPLREAFASLDVRDLFDGLSYAITFRVIDGVANVSLSTPNGILTKIGDDITVRVKGISSGASSLKAKPVMLPKDLDELERQLEAGELELRPGHLIGAIGRAKDPANSEELREYNRRKVEILTKYS